ncbi:4-hydroxy-tetrahydrodipicolinate reductase [Liberiplasma polymorphum]|uniref:4-hydroxy-tetrahydrodipicolinate reductase n=1 Tax=Liberiplasma polymorphum TaxID=3374570 RepID=UPI003774C900
MRIIVYGALGTMGKLTANYIESKEESLDRVDPLSENEDVAQTLDVVKQPTVIIDFSHPSQLDTLLSYAKRRIVPLVIATTGYTPKQEEKILAASKEIPIFKSANLSFGIHLLHKVLKKYAHLLENEYDIEIIEKHHRNKIDAPSGTAYLLAESIKAGSKEAKNIVIDRTLSRTKRTSNEIGISSMRGGNIVGEHSVIFAGLQDTITLTHEAHTKEVFAHGAYKAAQFIENQRPGLYTMDDLL